MVWLSPHLWASSFGLAPVVLVPSVALFLAIATFGNPPFEVEHGLSEGCASLAGFPNAHTIALLGIGKGHWPHSPQP